MDRQQAHIVSLFRARRGLAALGLGIALVAACGDDPAKPPGPPPPPTSPEGVVTALADAYRGRCLECVEQLLSPLPEAEFTFVPSEPMPDGTAAWGLETERLVTRRLLQPGALVAGEQPVPPDLWIRALLLALSPRSSFELAPLPAGLDRTRWNAIRADYTLDVFLDLQGETDYQVDNVSRFTVLVDLDKPDGAAGKYLLYLWEDLLGTRSAGAAVAGVEGRSLARVKALYAAASPITSEALFVQSLAEAYGRRDLQGYTSLLRQDFLFIMEPDPGSPEPSWGRAEEVRIHRRMFEPENVLPGEPPVPRLLWLRSLTMALTQQTSFVERPDLYRSPANPEGLDSARWRATEGLFGYSILFDMEGETDYLPQGRANFIVTADRCRLTGTPGRYALYRCEDLGSWTLASEETRWGAVKSLYR